MILWGHEHQQRAEALAISCKEDSVAIADLSRSNTGIQAVDCNDTTLTIWGHGNAETFAEMLDVECGLLIVNWAEKNSSLKTVEFVTCDAQHHLIPLSGFATRVAKFVADKGATVTIKALPPGQHSDDRSILWANPGSKTFCYITAPNADTFKKANEKFAELDATHSGDCASAGQDLVKAGLGVSVISSTLKTLRNCLVVASTRTVADKLST